MSSCSSTSLKISKTPYHSPYWQDSKWCYLVVKKTGTKIPVDDWKNIKSIYIWYLNMWLSNNMPHQPDVSELINLIPNHHTGTTMFHATTDSEPTVSSGGIKSGKEDPFQTWREGRGIRQLSVKPIKLYTSPYSKQGREQQLSAFLVWASDHPQDAPVPAMGMLWRAVVVQTPMFDHPQWNLKIERIHHNRHKHRPTSRKLNSEKEAHPWRTHGIVGIGLKKHLGLRWVLWHGGKANNTSIVLQHEQW